MFILTGFFVARFFLCAFLQVNTWWERVVPPQQKSPGNPGLFKSFLAMRTREPAYAALHRGVEGRVTHAFA